MLRTSVLQWMTNGISMLLESFVSLKRIETFLQLENLPFIENKDDGRIIDVDCESKKRDDFPSLVFARESLLNPILPSHKETRQKLVPPPDGERTLVVSGLTYMLTDPFKKTLLENASFTAIEKSLTVITGPVGSGKSTLLASIVTEIGLSSGKIKYFGNAAYVSQSPWVFSGTIQENILFGKALDEGKFTQVIEACALKEDLQRFPNGVMTFVGERGIVLSGCQRARVSLARAVYADADIYLLDDPLSGVDVKVGEHIFNQCSYQLLRHKMTIVVTYNEQHMKLPSQIVVLDKGSVLGKGVYSELKENNTLSVILDASHSKHGEVEEPSQQKVLHHTESTSLAAGDDDLTENLELSEEDRAIGSITSSLYWDYFRAGMHPVVMCLVFIFFLVTQGQYLMSYYHTDIQWNLDLTKCQGTGPNVSLCRGFRYIENPVIMNLLENNQSVD